MTYDTTILADSPLAYWKLDEASGTTLVDQVASYNLATANSPTLGVTGPITSDGAGNRAVGFASASSQYAQAASNTTFALGNVFSIEAWVNETTIGSNAARQSILANTGATATPALEIGGSFSTGRISITAPGVFVCESPSSTYTTTGVWTHLVYTRTAAGTGNQQIYMNGVAVTGPLIEAAQTYVDTACAWAIGRRTTNAQFFNGAIARVAIYGSALSAGQVATHYAAASGSSTPTARNLATLGVGT
jgi:hypothetical protein